MSARRKMAALVIAAAALVSPAAAHAATSTNLGTVGFASIAVDDAHQHVFVSETAANAIAEFNFAGELITTVPNVPGAWGMTISGNYLYVAESKTGDIAKIDLSDTPLAPQLLASGLDFPTWLVMTDGELWTAEDPGFQWGDVVAVSPESGTSWPLATNIFEPDLATSPGDPGTLFVAEDGLSPGGLYRFAVSSSSGTLGAKNTDTDQEGIDDLAVSPDGTRVIPAAGSLSSLEEMSPSTLEPDGLYYQSGLYPYSPDASAVSVSAAGLLAGDFAEDGIDSVIDVYPLGIPAPIASWITPDLPVTHGLAMSADGSMLFAVTTDGNADTIFSTVPTGSPSSPPPPPPPPPPSKSGSPSTVSSPSTAPHVTIKAFKSRHRRPDLSATLGAVREVFSTGQYRYFIAAKRVRCTGGATDVSFTVAHHQHLTRCHAGLILISPVAPHKLYTVRVRALRMRRHHVLRRGRFHTWRMYMPGNEVQWGPIP